MSKRQVNWIPAVERKMALLFQNLLFLGSAPEYFRKYVGIDLLYRSNRYVDGFVFLDPLDLQEVSKTFAQAAERDPNIFNYFASNCYKQSDAMVNISKGIHDIGKLKSKSNAELAQIWQNYTEAVKGVMPFLPVALIAERLFEQIISTKLMSTLGLNDKSQLQYFLQKLVIPIKENEVSQEMKNLLTICRDGQRNTRFSEILKLQSNDAARLLKEEMPDIYGRVISHLTTFGWMYIQGYLGSPMKLEQILTRMKTISKRNCEEMLVARDKRIADQTEKYQEFIAKNNIPADLQHDIRTAQEYIYLRMHRWDVLSIGHYNVTNLITEIGNRGSITSDQVVYLTNYEVNELLSNGVLPEKALIKERMKGYSFTFIDREAEILIGEELDNVKKSLQKMDYSGISRIDGDTASVGHSSGRVKIIFSTDDIDKVQEGDIVVSPMTTPDLTIALERASAIVTDEGGLLCHAAIVSRELGIPCVIGTRFATRALHDNDLVEVVADSGIGFIQILERAAL